MLQMRGLITHYFSKNCSRLKCFKISLLSKFSTISICARHLLLKSSLMFNTTFDVIIILYMYSVQNKYLGFRYFFRYFCRLFCICTFFVPAILVQVICLLGDSTGMLLRGLSSIFISVGTVSYDAISSRKVSFNSKKDFYV